MDHRRLSLGLVVLFALVALPVVAANEAAHQAAQAPPVQLGTSGGNINDITRRFCCSGTLGALVTKGGVGYVLSNSHVLARVGQAAVGEDISQPGLIDNGCRVPQIVADFSEGAPLNGSAGSNVDAALAQARVGMVDPLGGILDVGIPSAITATPTVGRGVAKAGRTTGITCASIGSVNTTVNVQYQKSCGQGKKFVISYANQVVINSSTFSAGGDSGSLIVTSDTAQPVALLFAGSSTTTIGNPIGDVVNALGVAFVGAGNHSVNCPAGGGAAAAASGPGKSDAAHERAAAVKAAHNDELMSIEAVQGVGVGVDENGESVIVVYTQLGHAEGHIPDSIEGVRTKIVRTDEFQAFDWANEEAALFE